MDLKSYRVNFYLFPLLLLVLWQTGSCHGANPVNNRVQHRVANGVWGGQEIHLNVTDTGADLEFSCATGHIDEPLMLNSSGRFSVKGTVTAGSMGPTREDKPPKPQAAVFTGEVHEKSLSLKMTLTDTKETREYSLDYGSSGRIHRCK
jgi:hypothetical protein